MGAAVGLPSISGQSGSVMARSNTDAFGGNGRIAQYNRGFFTRAGQM
jgi:hypothetical protein